VIDVQRFSTSQGHAILGRMCQILQPARIIQRGVFMKAIAGNAFAACVLWLLASAAFASTLISPGNHFLLYTGRIDFSQPNAPQISWPGTSIAANFTGNYLAITLDDQSGQNYFNVFIDGDLAHPHIIQAMQGEKTYVVATDLTNGNHQFLLTKRTEGQEGATTIKQFVLADHGKLLWPPARPRRRIEFYGDSITSGLGNESPDDGPDDLAKDMNNFMAYDAIAARNLRAEMHVISQSGIGIMVSWFDFTMPQFYDQLSAVNNNDTRWNFAKWTPDVVVINLLQNDSWLIDRDKVLSPAPTKEQIEQAYIDFARSIRGKYPKAYIVCALGSMDATKAGSPWPGYIASAVEKMKQENAKEKIDVLFFEYTGNGAHPRVKQHQANAEKLTALIKRKMGW
jgi:lysophospholipase L1-like esterase